MIKKIYPFIVLLMLTQKLFAIGFQIEVSGGYGFPAARDEEVASFEMDTDSTYKYWKDGLVSHGNGLKLDINATLLLDDYWGIIFGTGFSLGGGYTIERKAIVHINSLTGPEDVNWKVKANHIPITLGIKLQGAKRKIMPYAYVAPGIIIPFGTKGEHNYKFVGSDKTAGRDTTVTLDADLTDKYTIGFVVSSGLGAMIKISNSIGVKFEFNPVYATARLLETTAKYELNDTLHIDKVVFKKDTKKLPPDKIIPDDPYYTTEYYHRAPYISFSSIAAKIGIVFRF